MQQNKWFRFTAHCRPAGGLLSPASSWCRRLHSIWREKSRDTEETGPSLSADRPSRGSSRRGLSTRRTTLSAASGWTVGGRTAAAGQGQTPGAPLCRHVPSAVWPQDTPGWGDGRRWFGDVSRPSPGTGVLHGSKDRSQCGQPPPEAGPAVTCLLLMREPPFRGPPFSQAPPPQGGLGAVTASGDGPERTFQKKGFAG